MKKINFLKAALAAFVVSFSLASCETEVIKEVEKEVIKEVEVEKEVIVEVEKDNNWSRYQAEVNKVVADQKKHNKCILLVAFGSTWQCAYDAFDATQKAYQEKFTDYDVFVSFSSAICINRAMAGENTDARYFYAPNFWLHAFGENKYDEILVQSLQVIPGEEFNRVINYLKDFANNYLGDLDDTYLSQVTLKLGAPLLTSNEGDGNDVDACAAALNEYYGKELEKGLVAFMGHGNPDSYDSYKANVRYTELETALQTINPKYFVGTVDMPNNYKADVWSRIQAQGQEKAGHISLHALMSIAGDHAHNDMVGEGEEYWDSEDEASEENSWLEYFKNVAGYTVEGMDNPLGLLSVPGVLAIWMNHTATAVEDEGLEDYYHSMFPEE